MANWTHVNAIFRVDFERPLNHEIDITPVVEHTFGKVWYEYCETPDAFEKIYEKRWQDGDAEPKAETYTTAKEAVYFLPHGDENSCKISIWENPNKNALAAYTISVFGDLHGHDTTWEIMNWFVEVCRRIGNYHLRQAVITAENEWSRSVETAVYINKVVTVTAYDTDGRVTNTYTRGITAK